MSGTSPHHGRRIPYESGQDLSDRHLRTAPSSLSGMEYTRQHERVSGATLWTWVAVAAIAGACAPSGDSGSAAASDAEAGAVEQPAPERPSESPGSAMPGEETGQAEQAEPVDMELAARGADLYTRKGCVACHKIGGGRLVGPDLMGVTSRRSYGWIYAMVTAPDSMLRSDSTAKALYAEYFTPMPDQRVQPDEARALYEYLRARTDGLMQSTEGTGSEADATMLAGHRHRRGAGMGRRGPRAGPGMHHSHHGTSF